eukprot:scaffold2871_cov163-Amphora_coffeaeformis.AAC.7
MMQTKLTKVETYQPLLDDIQAPVPEEQFDEDQNVYIFAIRGFAGHLRAGPLILELERKELYAAAQKGSTGDSCPPTGPVGYGWGMPGKYYGRHWIGNSLRCVCSFLRVFLCRYLLHIIFVDI